MPTTSLSYPQTEYGKKTMNVIYVEMSSSNQRVTLPKTHDMEGKGCALFEISGRVAPYTDMPLFLCVDFIEESTVGGKTLPILRRIQLIPDDESPEASIDQVFHKMLWLPTSRDRVDELRVYISDEHGNIRSFDYCQISCTLVCIPHVK